MNSRKCVQKEVLAPFRVGDPKRAASHRSTAGVGIDGFHPRVPMDLSVL